MSVIADGILQANSAQNASREVAAETFALARDGYITLNQTSDGVVVRCTAKPISGDFELERRLLLDALSPQVCLTTPHQVPVAQTITAITALLLRQRGLTHKASPRRLMRRTRTGLIAFVTIGGIVASAIASEVIVPAIALVVLVTLGWNTNTGVRTISNWVGFYTKQGRQECRRFNKLNGQIATRQAHRSDSLLAYELLWTAGTTLVHAPDETPSWYEGEWPAEPEERSALLHTMIATIAAALSQAPGKRGRFALNQELVREAELYQFFGSVKDAGEIMYGIVTDTPIDLGPDS